MADHGAPDSKLRKQPHAQKEGRCFRRHFGSTDSGVLPPRALDPKRAIQKKVGKPVYVKKAS
jgi:hypothetical protein